MKMKQFGPGGRVLATPIESAHGKVPVYVTRNVNFKGIY